MLTQKLRMDRRLSVTIFLCCLITAMLQAQNPQSRKWIVPPQQVSFPGTTVSALPSSSNALEYNGQVANDASNVMHDVNGNLLFFIVDGTVYDKNGFLISDIYNPLTYPNKVTGTSEYLIIPVPGNCTQYYLVAGSYDFPNVSVNLSGVPHPYYITLDMSLPNQNGYGPSILGDMISANGLYDNVAVLLDNPNGTLDFVDPNNSKSTCLHFAVTPLRPATNDRFLYMEYRVNGKFARFKVTSTGIFYDGYNFQITLATLSSQIRAEMELAVLPNGNYRIAWPYEVASLGHQIVHVAEYSNVTGDMVPSTTVLLNLPSGAKIHGLEFSKDGRYLYVTHTVAPYVQYVDLQTSNAFTPLQPVLSTVTQPLMNPADFQYSHIEVDNNGFLLFARANDISGINIGFVNSPVGLNWVQGVIQTGVPINMSIYSSSPSTDIFNSRQLNDQVDGDVYQVFPPSTPPSECCLTNTIFTKEVYTADISLGANQIWQPGSNPFVNLIGNGNVVTIRSSLIIPAGMTITIRNMRFEFAPRTYDQSNNPIAGANIEINRGATTNSPGGRLIVDNSTLTVYSSCGKGMWEGIEVRGHSGVAQGTINNSPQGWLRSINSSRIENAWRAVVVAEVANPLTAVFPLTVVGTTGGVVQASGATRFTNNYISVLFMSYTFPTATTDNNVSDFSRCTFETTDQLWDQFAASPFSHVILWDTKGITFRGNLFNADETTSPYTVAMNNTGYGIWSLNSFFSVFPAQGNFRNTFQNMTYGIAAANIFGTRTVYIDQTEFNNNYRGVYLSGVPWATVTRNNFKVYRWPINLTQEAYGLYLNYSRGFKVQENDFTYSNGNSPAASAFGIIVNQSNPGRACGLYDEIYRNTFHSINIGIQAQGNNSEQPFAACYPNSSGTPNNVGLVMKCNRFYNNVDAYDIRVANYVYNNGTFWGNIGYQQGNCTSVDAPANNQYSHDCNYTTSDFTIDGTFSVANPNAVQYSWSSFNQTLPLSPTCYTTPVPASGVNLGGCAAYTYNAGVSCPSKIINNPINGSVRADIAYYEAQRDAINATLAAGNSQSYYNAINNLSPGQALNTLLAGSPYLSDGVLIAAINHGFPAGTLKQIIIANSPVSPAVIAALNQISLPSGIRNQINAAQVGVSPRTLLVEQMSAYSAQRSLSVDELIRNFMNDTIIVDGTDSVIEALKKYQIPEFRNELAKAFMEKKDTLNAKKQVDTLRMLGGADNFVLMFEVLLKLDREGQSCFGVASDPVKRGNVEYVAADDSKRVCADANALLQLVFLYQFNEYIDSDPQNSAASRIAQEVTPSQVPMSNAFAVYPNPSSGTFTLDYTAGETDAVVYEVYSVTGSMLKSETLLSGSQQKQISLADFAAGTYLFRIMVNGIPEYTERIVISD